MLRSVENGGFNSVPACPAPFAPTIVRTVRRLRQDDWKVRPEPDPDLGLRYSYFGALSAKQNNLPRRHSSAPALPLTPASPSLRWQSVDTAERQLRSADRLQLESGYLQQQAGRPGRIWTELQRRRDRHLRQLRQQSAHPELRQLRVREPVQSRHQRRRHHLWDLQQPDFSIGFAANPNAITTYNSNGLPTAGNANVVMLGDGHGHVPTIYLQHYSLDTEYQFGREIRGLSGL